MKIDLNTSLKNNKHENSLTKTIMTSDPLRNNVDDDFIDQLNQHISNKAVSILIQDYIKKLVIHEVDVITDSDWFDCKVNDAVEDFKND